MKKLKYMIKYLGVIDYYGNKIVLPKYREWMETSCKGKWIYYSPKRSDMAETDREHPFFFDMEFHFSRKTDLIAFRKKFG